MVIEGVLIGIGAGLLAGIMGVGGGIVIIPGLVLLGDVGQHTAQGVSLAVIVVTGVAGSVVNYRQRFIKLRTVVGVAPVALLFALLGGILATALEPERLARAFGLFQIGVGVWLVWGRGNKG
ncbi:MAG: sulfite exporter TauE/SafE family protein [Chloroflexi bacterium]|nr:sulfite exporter TauE/SafE family protein [Chloroflexota bacterium]